MKGREEQLGKDYEHRLLSGSRYTPAIKADTYLPYGGTFVVKDTGA